MRFGKGSSSNIHIVPLVRSWVPDDVLIAGQMSRVQHQSFRTSTERPWCLVKCQHLETDGNVEPLDFMACAQFKHPKQRPKHAFQLSEFLGEKRRKNVVTHADTVSMGIVDSAFCGGKRTPVPAIQNEKAPHLQERARRKVHGTV